MNWEAIYRRKVSSADTALAAIQSGDRVYLGGGAGVPVTLIQGLTRRADELRNVEITQPCFEMVGCPSTWS
jgi:4-hydroxybutyrate CoA-transferase